MFGLSKYAMWGMAAIIVALGIAIEVQTLRLRYAHDDIARKTVEIKDLNVSLDAAAEANGANHETIERLKLANAQWARMVQQAASAEATALSEAQLARDSAARARSQANTQLENEAHGNAQCDAALRVDLGAVCPELRQRLFDRSEKLRTH